MKTKAACQLILNKLCSTKNRQLAWIFYEPIEAIFLGLPDYYTIVKKPMDLSTVKSRLDSDYYLNVTEFAKDVRLIFYNTYLYTNPDHLCYQMAKKLQIIFEELYAKHTCNMNGSNNEKLVFGSKKNADSSTKFDDDSNSQLWPQTLDDLNPMFEQLSQPKPQTIDIDEGKPFTYEDDVDFHAMLQQLNGETLLQVYHMICKMEGFRCNKEMEFNVGALKTSTKRSILAHIQSKGITGKRTRRKKNITY